MALVESEDIQKLETRIEKRFREEREQLAAQIEKDHRLWQEARDEVSKKFSTVVGNYRDLKKELDTGLGNLEVQQRKELERMEQADEENRRDALKQVGSTEQAIKRLDREIEILSKDLAALKKDALSGADLKPLIDRIKKLESAK